jgi:hypothetical protein
LQCAAKPKRVLAVPENKLVTFEWSHGWTSFVAQPLALDSAYMIES